jgi:hypothetical protein
MKYVEIDGIMYEIDPRGHKRKGIVKAIKSLFGSKKI